VLGANDKMELNEFKDRLFDIINETNNLPISDIVMDDNRNLMKIYLSDGTLFTITCKKTGIWSIVEI